MHVPGRSKVPGGCVGAQTRPGGQGLGSGVKPPQCRGAGRVGKGEAAVVVLSAGAAKES